MGNTTDLRRELKKRFYPLVAAHGFHIDKSAGPFGVDFRRMTADGIDVFDLQWDKYGRPRFVVNFGLCPATGAYHFGEHVLPEKVLAYMGSPSGRLGPGKGAGNHSWFRQDRAFFRRVVLRQQPRPAAEVVDELLGVFPELLAWFRDQRPGPHMVFANRHRQQRSAMTG